MRDQGDYAQAIAYFKQGFVWRRDKVKTLANEDGGNLFALGTVASLQGQHHRAACLFGAGEAWQQKTNWLRLPHNQIRYGRHINATQAFLGDIAYEAAFAEGQAMTSEQAFEYALEGQPSRP